MTAAANYLVQAAMIWLSKHSKVEKFYDLSLAGLRQVVDPGFTLRVQAREYVSGRKPIDIDQRLIVIEARRKWDSTGHFTTGLQVATVGRWQTGAVEILADNLGKSIVMEAHPQMGPGLDTITYREHLDDTHTAHCQFFLGEEITQVNEVVVRMRVDALRATVRPLNNTGQSSGASNATSSSSSSKLTADNGGNTTNTGVNANVITDTGGPSGIYGTDTGNTATPALGVNHNHPIPHVHPFGHSHTVNLPAHGHGMDHTHPIPHDHTFTPNVTLIYGVYDDTSGTYLATELDYRVNGGAWVAISVGLVISGATGWYALDITNSVADSVTGRPLATVFDVEFRARSAGGKRAQITAQIERRVVVQSIATF